MNRESPPFMTFGLVTKKRYGIENYTASRKMRLE